MRGEPGQDRVDVGAGRQAVDEGRSRHRLDRREQERLREAHGLVRQVARAGLAEPPRQGLQPLQRRRAHEGTARSAGSRRRIIRGANGPSWRRLARPSRTSSSAAEKADAVTVARIAGVAT